MSLFKFNRRAAALTAARAGTQEIRRGSDSADAQFDAKRRLEDSMLDPGAAKYRNVDAVRATVDGRPILVFCGEVNGKNAMGGYTGFQRFIASAGAAATESAMDDFGTAWARFCEGGIGGRCGSEDGYAVIWSACRTRNRYQAQR